MAENTTAPHVYPVSFRTGRLVLWAALAALGVGLAAGVVWPSPSPLRGIVAGLLVAYSLYSAYRAAVTQLTLSAAGIEYRGVAGSTAASWDQVQRIRRVTSARGGNYIELVLADSRRRIRLNDFDFGNEGTDGPVARDLRAYAPQLFTEK